MTSFIREAESQQNINFESTSRYADVAERMTETLDWVRFRGRIRPG